MSANHQNDHNGVFKGISHKDITKERTAVCILRSGLTLDEWKLGLPEPKSLI